MSRPSTLPTNSPASSAAGQQRVGLLDQRVALGRFLADRQEPDLRPGDAVALAGEHGAHLRELHQPLRPGTRRWRRRRAARSACRPGTGIGVAIAGRATPLIRPMRSSADAMVAPVLPADTMADALPSRTASAARTSDESFIVRTLDPGSASMAITSDAGITSRPWSVPSSSGRPTSTTVAELGRRPDARPRRSRPAPCLHPSRRRRWAGDSRVPYSTSMAWRPWYQPQFGHTT